MRPGSALSGPAGRPLLGPPSAARAGPSPRRRADGCSNIRHPAGIFELVEFVGNGTYGQVSKNWFSKEQKMPFT
ncbi:TRAF2 and NCK-interacting protein kinase [Manis javanica]|nr:TRAF2 and NCK-interacting protein kinase [Manis javanica]